MRKRDYRLDLLRVISMIMVVIIHIANYYCRAFNDIDKISYLGALIFNTISRISVPFFFMISGATLLSKKYDKDKNKERIIKKIITLIVITIIYFIWDKYYMNKDINIIYLLNKPERKLLWFMYAIIGIYISLPFIKCMVDKMGKDEDKLFVILWLMFNGILKGLNIGNTYLIPIISGTYYLGYFIIGHMIIKYYDYIRNNKNNKLLLITSIISFIIVVILTYFISINKGKHFTKLLTYSNALIMIASLSSFIYLYFNIKDKKYIIISKLSNLSFGIYLFHAIILDFIMKLIPYQNIYSYIGIPVILFIVVFITSVIVNILKKTYISRYL
ncbi:MAG: acyltransferase family protein [Bacilli bacterium]|nr:acyltransferase family protein [Bacilli bacterium]